MSVSAFQTFKDLSAKFDCPFFNGSAKVTGIMYFTKLFSMRITEKLFRKSFKRTALFSKRVANIRLHFHSYQNKMKCFYTHHSKSSSSADLNEKINLKKQAFLYIVRINNLFQKQSMCRSRKISHVIVACIHDVFYL